MLLANLAFNVAHLGNMIYLLIHSLKRTNNRKPLLVPLVVEKTQYLPSTSVPFCFKTLKLWNFFS